ncbi:MAG TPA: fumarylacetoacetate hydrolase family protein [Candidatus Thermoplasmatota archaeon]|nr:fumarylacetoacetate hydrolase family protein [Candidatus Thermoplasmatota archaeon]
MRLCSFYEYESVVGGVLVGDRVYSLEDVAEATESDLGPDLSSLVKRRQVETLRGALAKFKPTTGGWKPDRLKFAAPFRDPPKIWGIGLNFREHATDLEAPAPDEPASYMRPATALADPSTPLRLPRGIGRFTGEAEIGVVLGAPLSGDVTREEARDAVLGFAPALDLTAEDLVRKNPRYLVRAKSYPDSCAFGPFLVTKDEWEPKPATTIATVVNGKTVREAPVSSMAMDPYALVAWHAAVFPWQAGDLLLTGTPGAGVLNPGDTLEARIDGLPDLATTVA